MISLLAFFLGVSLALPLQKNHHHEESPHLKKEDFMGAWVNATNVT